MSFCKNCGASLNEGAKFCSNCGAVIEAHAAPEVAESVQEPIQEAASQPVVPPVATQPFVQPPAEPIYAAPQAPIYVQPVYQNPVQNENSRPGLAMPILGLVFSSLAFLFFIILSGTYSRSDREAFAIFSILFSVTATPFGIIGLIKSIKGCRVAGIVISAIALSFIFIAFFASWGAL